MTRIRTVKPDFFRHERLQDLEAAHPGAYVMLVYIALWTQCDNKGTFLWKVRTMKLDILPFLDFDLEKTLQILQDEGFVQKNTAEDGTAYGFIPTFQKHQRFSGKEAQEGQKFPLFTTGKQQGSNREATGKHPETQEGKGIEEEGRRAGVHAPAHEDFSNSSPPRTAAQPDDPDPYPTTHAALVAWGKGGGDWQPLADFARRAAYDPSLYGPVGDEVRKFTNHWLDTARPIAQRAEFIANPVDFWKNKGGKWLENAKSFNKPPKNHPRKLPMQPQTRTGPVQLSAISNNAFQVPVPP